MNEMSETKKKIIFIVVSIILNGFIEVGGIVYLMIVGAPFCPKSSQMLNYNDQFCFIVEGLLPYTALSLVLIGLTFYMYFVMFCMNNNDSIYNRLRAIEEV